MSEMIVVLQSSGTGDIRKGENIGVVIGIDTG